MFTLANALPGTSFRATPESPPCKFVRRHNARLATCVTTSGTPYLLKLDTPVYPA